MKKITIAAMLCTAILVVPISASASPFWDRGLWEAAVGSYMNVSLPAGDLAQYQSLALPSAPGDIFNFNVPLAYSSGFYYTSTFSSPNFYANGTFYHTPNGWQFTLLPVSAFGFDVTPFGGPGDLVIKLYTHQFGEITQTVNLATGPAFFGWVGDSVTGFSTYSVGSYGLGNFVQGAAVPEPASLLLLGAGLAGLGRAWRKRRG